MQVSNSTQPFRSFTKSLLRDEGLWQGLWRPGLPTNMCAVAVSQGLRMGLYPSVRVARGRSEATGIGCQGPLARGERWLHHAGRRPHRWALWRGLDFESWRHGVRSWAYFVGAPFWLVKTRQQATRQFLAQQMPGLRIYPVPRVSVKVSASIEPRA